MEIKQGDIIVDSYSGKHCKVLEVDEENSQVTYQLGSIEWTTELSRVRKVEVEVEECPSLTS